MNQEIVNPFKNQNKNWAADTQNRFNTSSKQTAQKISKNPTKTRIAKSFKIYPGELSRNFDKRVKKLQVHFDDLDFPKEFVDSGKYLMFLMSFAEKYKVYELYKQLDDNFEFELSQKEIEKYLKNF